MLDFHCFQATISRIIQNRWFEDVNHESHWISPGNVRKLDTNNISCISLDYIWLILSLFQTLKPSKGNCLLGCWLPEIARILFSRGIDYKEICMLKSIFSFKWGIWLVGSTVVSQSKAMLETPCWLTWIITWILLSDKKRQNIWPIHWKMCILFTGEKSRPLTFKSL